MNSILNFLISMSGTVIVVLAITAAFIFTKKIFEKQARDKASSATKQIVLFIILLIGFIALILALPFQENKSDILGIIGIVLSAAFALSSTTFLGNIFAGLMNKIIGSYNIGDFIRIQEYFGRISDIGLFHTELQVDNRDLVTLQHLFLATNPYRVIRSSGTIISTEVSLGYDVNRNLIEKSLLEAAQKAGLTDPFVYITSLGDFSIVYKINGMLADTNKCITANSILNKMVLDSLHEAKIEIVSPTFMNQRQVNETIFIPKKIRKIDEVQVDSSPESIIFDKAMKAETIAKKNERLQELELRIEEMKKSKKEITDQNELLKLDARIEKWVTTLEKSKQKIKEEKERLANEDKQ